MGIKYVLQIPVINNHFNKTLRNNSCGRKSKLQTSPNEKKIDIYSFSTCTTSYPKAAFVGYKL